MDGFPTDLSTEIVDKYVQRPTSLGRWPEARSCPQMVGLEVHAPLQDSIASLGRISKVLQYRWIGVRSRETSLSEVSEMPRRSADPDIVIAEKKIEANVGERVRVRRGLLGISQTELASRIGITFQQVQKYENGSNRVSIGKLVKLAEILDVPITFFFDGLEGGLRLRSDGDTGDISRRELDVLRAWRSAPPEIAGAVLELLRASTNETGQTAHVQSVVPNMPRRRGRPPKAVVEAAEPMPKRRGRPPKHAVATADVPQAPKPRRTRGAIWSPLDIK